jgi:hypothetical protein
MLRHRPGVRVGLRMVCHGLRSYALLGIAGCAGPMGDCWPWGGAGEELLGATLSRYGTAGHRPSRGCGPRPGPRRKRLPGTM